MTDKLFLEFSNIWACRGHVVDMLWTCCGHVVDMSTTFQTKMCLELIIHKNIVIKFHFDSQSHITISRLKISLCTIWQQCLPPNCCHLMVQCLPLQHLPVTSSPATMLFCSTMSPPVMYDRNASHGFSSHNINKHKGKLQVKLMVGLLQCNQQHQNK